MALLARAALAQQRLVHVVRHAVAAVGAPAAEACVRRVVAVAARAQVHAVVLRVRAVLAEEAGVAVALAEAAAAAARARDRAARAGALLIRQLGIRDVSALDDAVVAALRRRRRADPIGRDAIDV